MESYWDVGREEIETCEECGKLFLPVVKRNHIKVGKTFWCGKKCHNGWVERLKARAREAMCDNPEVDRIFGQGTSEEEC